MPSFIKSCFSSNDWITDDKKEICFIGRSNVGKSSLINALANAKIAKTSNTPGRTQLANFYDFDKFRLIDLPGYGYAKVSKSKHFELSKIISEYIYLRKNLVAVFQIIDISVITDLDLQMSELLSNRFNQHYIVLNKADKEAKSYFDNNFAKIAAKLKKDKENIVCVSAKNKTNIPNLKKLIGSVIL
ncbi:YihA family ribosome biogenesis GTP-binding protein [Malacoplasma penetrans]|uniref:Probable GTP-binding protein EngB n=1 Tax=Malacoplasma penetrans (strain HF-2) TaxID=272633 RepID=ENGB_MALP2|nr:ribosome biogenesis GTP-binding protein YihA/YsxC [Malacoplasma penetrans]Q8EX09.1 RecName: Full=Probable GTP-binding protein EngB [Malacoplasma penetrans HF-2]RXY97376.1 YihA family ribosome biogenesis GTP-binding protein [Malacoplasma penetrans]BAC43831.1 predicted GTP-binding protein [Malacoplasma penetrans HF-2]